MIVVLPSVMLWAGETFADDQVLWIPVGLTAEEEGALRGQVQRDTGSVLVDATEARNRLTVMAEEAPSHGPPLVDQAQEAYRELRMADAHRLFTQAIEETACATEDSPSEVAAILIERANVALGDNRREEALEDMVLAIAFSASSRPDPNVHGPPVLRLFDEARGTVAHLQTGTIEVQATPADAMVRVDGRETNPRAPLELRAGLHFVVARKLGFVCVTRWIRLGPGPTLSEPIELDRATDAALARQLLDADLSEEDVSREAARLLGLVRIVRAQADPEQYVLTVIEAATGRVVVDARANRSEGIESLSRNFHMTSEPDDDDSAWYEQWYVWTTAGVVVAGVITIVLIATWDRPVDLTVTGPP